jgi:hypothetical protein
MSFGEEAQQAIDSGLHTGPDRTCARQAVGIFVCRVGRNKASNGKPQI